MTLVTAICVLPLLVSADDLGLRVAPGFRVSVYSGPELANDIYAMTLDAQGRVVVTSQGWVKLLHPSADGKRAERASVIATTKRGGLSLCFDGDDLLFTGDGWFSRYRMRDGKLADTPERIVPMRHSEHGGHGIRQGPDGWWYVLGGNDTGFTAAQHSTLPGALIRTPEGGALMRFSPDFKKSEIIAHGWRNPYRFDFNALGDLFLYDSDTERDNFLPWYTPTRVYHVAVGGHHGWRLEGFMRSWCRPGYYLDSVKPLAPLGRGSPTGVVCYRHEQFAEHYRGGLFVCDWTFGKVFFLPLKPTGDTYVTKPEIFLETVGTSGFNPTDAAVAPDGSLLISIGGRGTRGAVYRVEYVGDGTTPPARRPAPKNDLEAVLHAPQPLDAWSRARWVPLARKLGAKPFASVVEDKRADELARVRAIEVLTELFGGLPADIAEKVLRDESALVKERLAWSLGRAPCAGFSPLLGRLATDLNHRVNLAAVLALTERLAEADPYHARIAAVANLGHGPRMSQAAARLLARLPDEAWRAIEDELPRADPDYLCGAGHAFLERDGDKAADRATALALAALGKARSFDEELQAVRLIMRALGDWCLRNPPAEVYTGYALQRPLTGREKLAAQARAAVRPFFTGKSGDVDIEATRLLAMLEDDDVGLVRRVAAQWTADSPPSRDVHYLIVLARLRGPWPAMLAAQVANVILDLNRKLGGQEQRDKQNWNMRLTELVTDLVRLQPRIADEMLQNPKLIHGAHVYLTTCLPAQHRERAAQLFLDAVRKDAGFEWTGQLVELFRDLPARTVRPILRAQWDNFGLRERIVLQLADAPEETDRQRFLDGLAAAQPATLLACVKALATLPRDATPDRLVPVLAALRTLQQEPRLADLRREVLDLINRQAGQSFAIAEKGTRPEQLGRSYQPVFDWFRTHHPALATRLDNVDGEDPAYWDGLLKQVNWAKGDPARGEKVFVQRACATCHAGSSRVGPDLTGVATRFSRTDLFQAILFPSRDVAPAYRTVTMATKSGQVHHGIVIFFSADGSILQTDASTTVRVASADIEAQLPGSRSLMPAGLLKDLKPVDLADLYSYLLTLKATPP